MRLPLQMPALRRLVRTYGQTAVPSHLMVFSCAIAVVFTELGSETNPGASYVDV